MYGYKNSGCCCSCDVEWKVYRLRNGATLQRWTYHDNYYNVLNIKIHLQICSIIQLYMAHQQWGQFDLPYLQKNLKLMDWSPNTEQWADNSINPEFQGFSKTICELLFMNPLKIIRNRRGIQGMFVNVPLINHWMKWFIQHLNAGNRNNRAPRLLFRPHWTLSYLIPYQKSKKLTFDLPSVHRKCNPVRRRHGSPAVWMISGRRQGAIRPIIVKQKTVSLSFTITLRRVNLESSLES